ncbi:acyltransferase [Cellulomonas sp. URHD0024]|uniref:acyltransferase family protein n=1 Tax=Cellulomonas sp. URHD0024 TaxID=1302620 RepID=UPI00042993A7|nr:acyltransferase [Cellulomonas sp. URHD0024]
MTGAPSTATAFGAHGADGGATLARGVSSRGRYEHIDALRALAVMLVVVAHAGLGGVVPGGSGVTIFFAISGFIITHILLTEREKTGAFSVSDFYLRRLLKLAPPFLLLIAVPTLLWAITNPLDWGAFASQVFFTFNWVYMHGLPAVLPGSPVVWSLAIEEQFYIAFALIWLGAVLLRRHLMFLSIAAGATIVGSLTIRILLVSSDGALGAHRRIYYGTDTRADGIAFGILAAVLFALSRRGRLPARVRTAVASGWAPAFALVLYLASLVIRDEWFRETLRYTFQAAAAAAVILYGLERRDGRVREALGRVAGIRIVQVIGLASYSIYLIHLVVDVALRPLLAGWPTALAFGVSVVSGVAIGVAVWAWLERPVEAFKRRLMARRAAARVDGPAPEPSTAAATPGSPGHDTHSAIPATGGLL